MVYLGMLAADGGIDMFLVNKGGTILVYYQNKFNKSYMYLALDGTVLVNTFKNELYEYILVNEFMLRRDWVLSKIAEL